MFYRQICFSLLSTVFLLGCIYSPQAMDDDDAKFKQIQKIKNPIPATNSDLDDIQPLLTSPIKWEVRYTTNSTIFLTILENNTKVLIKKSHVKGKKTHYSFEQAMAEFMAPKVARAYFDEPTLLLTQFVAGEDGQFQVRQYFIDGELKDGDLEKEEIFELLGDLHLSPSLFNRKANFLFDLGLFDNFIAAADRNITQLFWCPSKNIRNKQQKFSFFAMDYAEIFYDVFRGRLQITIEETLLAHSVDCRTLLSFLA